METNPNEIESHLSFKAYISSVSPFSDKREMASSLLEYYLHYPNVILVILKFIL